MTMYADAPSTRFPVSESLQPLTSPLRWFRRRFLRRPGSTMGLIAALLIGGFITINAVALQTERHPAPMFTTKVEEHRATAPEAVPVPPARPQAAELQPAPAPARPQRQAAREAEAVKPAVAAPAANQRDQMNSLFRNASGNSVANPPPATEPVKEASERIMQVQRALNKLGYGPLKPDGNYGAASRQALERFEADRKLAVRGEPMGRTLRELARASGLVIE